MIYVVCSEKMAEMLPEKPAPLTEEAEPLKLWCADLIQLQDQVGFVIMCADTGFSFVLLGLSSLENLWLVIQRRMKKTFFYFGVRREIMEQFFDGPIRMCTGLDEKNQESIKRITRRVESLYEKKKELYLDDSMRLAYDLNLGLAKENPGEPGPFYNMREGLQNKYHIRPVYQSAFEIVATMDLYEYEAKRTLLIPAEFSFAQLHKSLQIAFGWNDYHRYAFQVGKVRVWDRTFEDFWENVQEEETDITLSAMGLRKGQVFTYIYDFGDRWKVKLQVKSKKDGLDYVCATCTSCEGAAPPEDVGGVEGFLDFLEGYYDPEHPRHKDICFWAMGWEDRPTAEWINEVFRDAVCWNDGGFA